MLPGAPVNFLNPRGEEPDAETLQNYNDIAVPGLQKSQKDYFLEQASKKKQEMEALVADVMRKKATALEEARTSEAAKRARAELEESAEKQRRVTAQTQLPPVDLSSQPLLSLSDPLGDLGLLPPLPSPADGGDEEGLGDGDERVELPPPPALALPAPLAVGNSESSKRSYEAFEDAAEAKRDANQHQHRQLAKCANFKSQAVEEPALPPLGCEGDEEEEEKEEEQAAGGAAEDAAGGSGQQEQQTGDRVRALVARINQKGQSAAGSQDDDELPLPQI
eukprot:XP_001695094.1 predicted protein [Chlamydomonas reinhardtii]